MVYAQSGECIVLPGELANSLCGRDWHTDVELASADPGLLGGGRLLSLVERKAP